MKRNIIVSEYKPPHEVGQISTTLRHYCRHEAAVSTNNRNITNICVLKHCNICCCLARIRASALHVQRPSTGSGQKPSG